MRSYLASVARASLCFVIFGLLVSACGKSSAPENPADAAHLKGASDAEACQAFIKALPKDITYDWATVPEDQKDPSGPALRIFYYGNLTSGKPPILFVNGGPAQDSHDDYKLMVDSKRVVSQWSGQPLVFFDQRGNGCSSPYPQGDSDEILGRLRFYGSSDIVRDAEVIRKRLLGDVPWRVIGQSYGGWIVHRYAVEAPEGLIAAYSQANVLDSDPIERVTNRIFSQNRVLETYFDRYPSDRAALQVLHVALIKNKCYYNADRTRWVCGLNSIANFSSSFAFVPNWPSIHRWLGRMVVNGTVIDKVLQDRLNKTVFAVPHDRTNLKAWPEAIIDAYDRNVPSFNRPTCEEVYERLRSRGENPEAYLLHECMVAMQYPKWSGLAEREAKLAKFTARFGDEHMTIALLKDKLLNHPALHFFLYSGDLDTMVPIENFTEEVASLGTLITYRQFANSGHDGFYTEPQVALDVTQASMLTPDLRSQPGSHLHSSSEDLPLVQRASN